jgi:ubiquitin C-terminal hydrolase
MYNITSYLKNSTIKHQNPSSFSGFENDDNITDDEELNNINYGVSRFKNIMGITCYINSILHILQQLPIFSHYITQAKFRDVLIEKINKLEQNNPILNKKDILQEFVVFELFKLFKISLETDDTIITPSTFKTLIGEKNDIWNEYKHQDSQEFFTFLISQLEEEVGTKCFYLPGLNYDTGYKNNILHSLKNTIALDTWFKFQLREYSPLKNMFNGLLQNNCKCMCCGTISSRYEPFITLPLSIPIKSINDIDKKYSIYDCLDHLILEEQLDIDNKINCDMCGLYNQGYNKIFLWQTPKILVIHIKRFLTNTEKITNSIEYPINNLDLSKYFDNDSLHKNNCTYNLVGINIHESIGYENNIDSGHYVSIIKNIINNNWYLYNDASPVKEIINEKDLQTNNAYMLFYMRHS